MFSAVFIVRSEFYAGRCDIKFRKLSDGPAGFYDAAEEFSAAGQKDIPLQDVR